MIGLLTGILPSLFKLGGKMIKDQDKQMEYAFKVQEMTQMLALKMLETKTYPWIDGLVKLAYASEAIIKGLFRPLAAAGLFIFGVYAELNNLQLSDTVTTLLFGALPAWGVDRGLEKRRKEKQMQIPEEDW